MAQLLAPTALFAAVAAAAIPISACDHEDRPAGEPVLARETTPAINAEIVPPPPKAARAATSGLDPGEQLTKSEVIDTSDGQLTCLRCDAPDTPTLILVGDPTTAAFRKDLQDVDAVLTKWGFNRVRPVAGLISTADGKISAADGDPAALADTRALRLRLGLQLDIFIPRPAGSGTGDLLVALNITQNRTLVLVDRVGSVVHSEVAPEDLGAIDRAISALLSPRPSPSGPELLQSGRQSERPGR